MAAAQQTAAGGKSTAEAPTPITPHARLAANDPASIVSFKGATVVLYGSETGNDGERVPVASLPLPLRANVGLLNTSRLTIATASGPRWVATSEVVLGAAASR